MSHEICDLCKELEDPESDYRDYFKQLGFPKKCPFEAVSKNVVFFLLNYNIFYIVCLYIRNLASLI